jgi:hypothetical protein
VPCGDIVARLEVLEPGRKVHTCVAEHPAAARFGPVLRERRVQSIQRDAEQHRKAALQRRRVEHREIRVLTVVDGIADPLQQPRPFQDLLGQRA